MEFVDQRMSRFLISNQVQLPVLAKAAEAGSTASKPHPQTREPMDLRRVIDADIRQLALALRTGTAGEFWPAVWD
jgi:hypothetical protein